MVSRKTQPPNTTLPTPVDEPVENLFLDSKNPRIAGLDLPVDEPDAIVRVLWKDRAVNELVDSIATSGYWRHEELFACNENGKLVVIEGNRRLAAVKLLTDDGLRNRLGLLGLPTLNAAEKQKLKTLPVIHCKRQDLWQYIGFKHVNGPQDWDSIAKAQYIARVFNDYEVPLGLIAQTIGDRHDTVRRLYRGLMVLEQAERTGVFDRDDRWNSRFAYSHLWTGLGYSNIQAFLGLRADRGFEPDPVPKKHLDRLGELCRWLYGSKKLGKEPVVRSQNPDLRNLDEALGNQNGIAALRSDLPLATSLNASRGDERLLREAIVVAEQKLKEARGLVLTGFSGDNDLLNRAITIQTIATSVLEEMENFKSAPRVRKKAKRSTRRSQ